ncbi:chemotaxis protein [Ciceribacter sp. L1K22]|nr:chemotaxis protein [Ciceribacter sp. L1K22]
MKNMAAALRVEQVSGEQDLVERLEGARVRIEQRFLDGGAVLLGVLDVLNRMVSSLEHLSASIDEKTAEATIGKLLETVEQLKALPSIETDRQQKLASVVTTETSLGSYIADMQETLRYLRTFATTAKITGAAIPDFQSFVEEILERIQFGTDQVNGLSEKIKALDAITGKAAKGGNEALESFRRSIPPIVDNLSRNAGELTTQRRRLAELAQKVAGLARQVQTKAATTLSAMQIGDITRQRIEHCQSAFEFLDDHLRSEEARSLTAENRQTLTAFVQHLVHEQLAEIARDFDRECMTIVRTIESFRADIDGLLSLQGDMGGGQSADQAIRVLETDIGSARALVQDIEQAAEKANGLGRGTIATVQELLKGISTIQLVRTDIQYMALNTNLRCSKLGEEGKAVNVVTAELRVFSGRLDEVAERVIVALNSLEEDAGKLGDTGGTTELSLDARLEEALESIRTAGDAMEEDMASLRACGADVSDTVTRKIAGLDFRAELGDVLAECSTRAQDLIVDANPDASGIAEALQSVGNRIYRTYTMASEREIHARIFGTEIEVSAPAASAPTSDEDLFDEALF